MTENVHETRASEDGTTIPLRADAARAAASGGKRPGVATRFRRGDARASALGARGAAAKVATAAAREQLGRLGLGDLKSAPEFQTFLDSAEEFRVALAAELCDLSGGRLDCGPSSVVASAALQLAGSRYLFVLAGREKDAQNAGKLFGKASALADSSRQNLIAAYHLAELGATARRAKSPALRPSTDDDAAEERALKARREQEALTVRGEAGSQGRSAEVLRGAGAAEHAEAGGPAQSPAKGNGAARDRHEALEGVEKGRRP